MPPWRVGWSGIVLTVAVGCGWWSAPAPGRDDAARTVVPSFPPVVTAVRLQPQAPGPDDTVTCAVYGPKADEPAVRRRLRWEVDDAVVARGVDHLNLAARGVDAGQRVACTLAPVRDEPVPMDRTVVRPRSRPWEGGNLLVLLADDVGIDKIGAYETPTRPPDTPSIDALARRGVRFEHAYAMPVCSPTRATLLTGRQPRRTGVGTGITLRSEEPDLPLTELLLPERLAQAGAGYASAAVGKWHLVSGASRMLSNPTDQGFDHFRGSLSNLQDGTTRSGDDDQSYAHWQRVVDGHVAWTDVYATTASIEDTIELARTLPEPWLLYVAFHAAHTPLHTPPADLAPLGPHPSDVERFDALVRSLDTAVGRIVAGLRRPREVTVVFLGDNGTPEHGLRHPEAGEHGKGSLQDSGVRVPLIVTGPAVARAGSVVQAPVQVADLFATLCELAGVDPDGTDPTGARLRIDGSSLVPYLRDPDLPALRPWAYTELFGPPGCLPDRCTSDRSAVYGAHGVVATLEGHTSVHPLEGATLDEAERQRLRGVAWLLDADLSR